MSDVKPYERGEIHEVIAENNGLFCLNFRFDGLSNIDFFRQDLVDVAEHFQDRIEFGEVNLGQDHLLITDFEVASVPTLLLFQGPEEIERVEQFWTPKILAQYLDAVSSFYCS